MTILSNAIDQQINYSIYSRGQTTETKIKLANQCNRVKLAVAVAAFATPIFALFYPTLFGLVFSCTIGLAAYDIFNMADNLGDASKLSAEGHRPSGTQSNIDMLLDSTFLAKHLHRYFTK